MTDPTDMNHHNLIAVTSRLEYAPRHEDKLSDEIFDAKELLLLPVPNLNCPNSKLLLAKLEGVLVIENSVNKKRITSKEVYFIDNPQDTGSTGSYMKIVNLASVTEVLMKGLSISRKVGNMLITVFTPSDLVNLFEYVDKSHAWKEMVAAYVNIDIESRADWSTRGEYDKALRAIVGTEIVVVQDLDGYDKPPATMSEIATDVICRKMEGLLNQVFEFTNQHRDVFYHASVDARGIRVARYRDVRAFVWHYEEVERQRQADLAKEEGLG